MRIEVVLIIEPKRLKEKESHNLQHDKRFYIRKWYQIFYLTSKFQEKEEKRLTCETVL